MKRLKLLLAPVVLVSYLAACASLELNAFKAVGVTQVSVDLAMTTYAKLVVAGKVSPEVQSKVRKDYALYQEVMKDAKGAVDIWKSLSPDERPPFKEVKGRVDAAVARAAVLLSEIGVQ
jgi:hypothetical protein